MADWSPFRDAKTRAEWRELLLLKQKGRCGLCGHRFPLESQGFDPSVYIALAATFDHIVARSNGGADDLGNLRIVHAVCNKMRGTGDRLTHLPSIPRALRSKQRPRRATGWPQDALQQVFRVTSVPTRLVLRHRSESVGQLFAWRGPLFVDELPVAGQRRRSRSWLSRSCPAA
jgi:5-methylcytosine-specific restriction endonuclease McrA